MKRGNLVIYDIEGTIIFQTGEAEGSLLPHVYPVGVPFLEIPFGTIKNKKLIKIDTSKDIHVPIFEDIDIKPTYEELELQLKALKGE